MTQVDFYILQDVEIDAQHRFACRLVSKAITTGMKVVLLAPDEKTAQDLDRLLWEYPEKRFLPHGLNGSEGAERAPISITWEDPGHYHGVLVNLTEEIPGYFARFDRLVEILVEANRQNGRKRYDRYRKQGYPLKHHNLEDWEAA
jgi:DNA polymerase-3 subunit chi